MKVTWVIENINKESSYLELAAAVKKLNYPLIEVNGDYKKEILKDLNLYYTPADCRCVIFNGSIEMAKLVRADLGNHCQPVIYSNFEKYKCSAYYSYFGRYLFNDKYCLMSLSELGRQRYSVYGQYGKEALIFCRPDSGEKTFQAQLLDIIDLDRFLEQRDDIKHELVLVSTPKNIKWEGRFICSKYKEIIAYSTYRFQGQISKIPSVPPETIKFCQEILDNNNYWPDSVFCLDLCQDNDNVTWLLELTSFSSAGLYSSNKENIVKRVSEIAWEDFNK